MPAPGNPRATANRRVMNNVHARLAALRRDLETGTVRSINIGHTLQGEDAATVTVEQELHSLRRLADGYHQRLAKIEAYLGDEAGFQEMDATQ
jgi:hypothetical protein